MYIDLLSSNTGPDHQNTSTLSDLRLSSESKAMLSSNTVVSRLTTPSPSSLSLATVAVSVVTGDRMKVRTEDLSIDCDLI